MKNKQKIPVAILADREVFEYLKEKVGDRKTKTEAYCDLLDKAQAGFISPFLRKQDCELLPNQCHVTVSDLATEWHWHRATVRSFLDAIETFGLLKRTRFSKSIVITMAVQTGHPIDTNDVQESEDLATQLQKVLSDWVTGHIATVDAGTVCGQLVRQAIADISKQDNHLCLNNGMGLFTEPTIAWNKDICETALGCIAHAALQRTLRKSRFDNGSPLVDFFRLELREEWNAFLEISKELSGFILDVETDESLSGVGEDKKLLKSLCKPFLSLASRAQGTAD